MKRKKQQVHLCHQTEKAWENGRPRCFLYCICNSYSSRVKCSSSGWPRSFFGPTVLRLSAAESERKEIPIHSSDKNGIATSELFLCSSSSSYDHRTNAAVWNAYDNLQGLKRGIARPASKWISIRMEDMQHTLRDSSLHSCLCEMEESAVHVCTYVCRLWRDRKRQGNVLSLHFSSKCIKDNARCNARKEQ